MDEDWLECEDPAEMLKSLIDLDLSPLDVNPFSRKLRLYMVACCCSFWLKLEYRSHHAIQTAEAFADDSKLGIRLLNARYDAQTLNIDENPFAFMSYLTASGRLQEAVENECWQSVPSDIRVNILRDIFGDTIRQSKVVETLNQLKFPFELDDWREWNNGTIVKIAQSMYDSRDFSDMPKLGDALEDAGCDDKKILNHCRGIIHCPTCRKRKGEKNHPPGMIFVGWGHGWQECPNCASSQIIESNSPHFRGCWVVDMILGKK